MPRRSRIIPERPINVRISHITQTKLRVLAALRNETQSDVVDDLLTKELRRLGHHIVADASNYSIAAIK